MEFSPFEASIFKKRLEEGRISINDSTKVFIGR